MKVKTKTADKKKAAELLNQQIAAKQNRKAKGKAKVEGKPSASMAETYTVLKRLSDKVPGLSKAVSFVGVWTWLEIAPASTTPKLRSALGQLGFYRAGRHDTGTRIAYANNHGHAMPYWLSKDGPSMTQIKAKYGSVMLADATPAKLKRQNATAKAKGKAKVEGKAKGKGKVEGKGKAKAA